MNKLAGASVPERRPISEDILEHVGRIAEQAKLLADMTQGKLQAVMNLQTTKAQGEKETLSREFPPLFHTLRANFYNIEDALSIIEDALSRTEL